jgi:hypothetical protein
MPVRRARQTDNLHVADERQTNLTMPVDVHHVVVAGSDPAPDAGAAWVVAATADWATPTSTFAPSRRSARPVLNEHAAEAAAFGPVLVTARMRSPRPVAAALTPRRRLSCGGAHFRLS